jgi:hypothetical protein
MKINKRYTETDTHRKREENKDREVVELRATHAGNDRDTH